MSALRASQLMQEARRRCGEVDPFLEVSPGEWVDLRLASALDMGAGAEAALGVRAVIHSCGSKFGVTDWCLWKLAGDQAQDLIGWQGRLLARWKAARA